MSESFAELFELSLKETDMTPGAIVTATVVAIDNDWVTVNAGLKSEGVIPRVQFLDENGQLEVSVNDEVEVAIESLEDGWGETKLSREKAKRAQMWRSLEKSFEADETVTGIISGKVKGGFTVDIDNVRAFLPGSLVDVRPIRDTAHLEGKELEFKVIKLDAKRNNVVVSRRSVLEQENSVERDALLANLEEGMEVTGVIKNLTDYGAFVDLGGIDGLLHITDMAWKRIKHPSEIVNVGDELQVKVLKFDKERNRVSLGLKQLGEDPWVAIARNYQEGTKVKARVTNLTDYGCFAELEEGVEGLVHVSEMDWTNKNIHPSKVVSVGEEIEVMVLDVDQERRRISLGIKQCRSNPWDDFATRFEKGQRISGKIKSITDFGIFIGLDGGIDGLVHLSDLSWDEAGEEAVRNFKKGDDVEAVILSIDPERERISLGIKQMQQDAFGDYVTANDKGAVVTGKVTEVDSKGAVVELAEEVTALLRASEISKARVDDASAHLNVGEEVEVKIISIDRKNRSIQVSIKAKDADEEKDALKEHATKAPAFDQGPKTIGDLIKAQMSDKS
ncbi:MAG: 30S ribosomal protein S1 [Pseudomonadota bacterium]|nr:30S ribosomal protein S1 [Gammaproteobacteria bacterium]MEC8010994.1 30S ribosomal protein S1 [Pseudomonadota bacterium]|tara:strand:+ start:106455 stop:108137 length:1683 start_codon:yes stop_codon:yes gene_type:complete